MQTDIGTEVAARLRGEELHAPCHFDVEVVGVIRRAVARQLISDRDGLIVLSDFRALPVRRWPITPLVERAYSLRAAHSVADAVYVALAEGLGATLLTCDARLAASHGHDARIERP
ncbi:type II toxin-antitoxin system VapC family toxin [soil metagenome]